MIKEKLEEVIDNLILNTKLETLIWNEGDVKDRRYERTLLANGEDGTEFEIAVKYTLVSNKWKIDESKYIWIRNKKLPNGHYYGSDDKVTRLKDILIEKYCQDLNPKESDISDALDEISKGISLSTYRDNKINKILK